jgi:hypothetical protein
MDKGSVIIGLSDAINTALSDLNKQGKIGFINADMVYNVAIQAIIKECSLIEQLYEADITNNIDAEFEKNCELAYQDYLRGENL